MHRKETAVKVNKKMVKGFDESVVKKTEHEGE